MARLGSKVQPNRSIGQQTRDFMTPGNDSQGQSQGITGQVANLAAGACGSGDGSGCGGKGCGDEHDLWGRHERRGAQGVMGGRYSRTKGSA